MENKDTLKKIPYTTIDNISLLSQYLLYGFPVNETIHIIKEVLPGLLPDIDKVIGKGGGR